MENDLIRRSDLLADFQTDIDLSEEKHKSPFFRDGIAYLKYAKEKVEKAPTVDAVEVVRCGGCRWYDPRTKNCLDGLYGVFEPDWFCKDGRRREECDA